MSLRDEIDLNPNYKYAGNVQEICRKYVGNMQNCGKHINRINSASDHRPVITAKCMIPYGEKREHKVRNAL